MFINKKAVKVYLKEKGKQCGNDFLIGLDKKVTELLDKSITNKSIRLKAEDIQ